MTDASPRSPGQPDSVRSIAERVLTRVERRGAYLDRLLDAELGSSGLNDADRRLLTEIVTGVVRSYRRLDWMLARFYRGDFDALDAAIRNVLRVALYQIDALDRVPHHAAVHEAVENARTLRGERAAHLVNGVLRAILRLDEEIRWPDAGDALTRLGVIYSHPDWIVRRWLQRFGAAETERLLAANNRRPSLSLRVNPLRGDVDSLEQYLRERGATVERSLLVPGMLRAGGFGSIAADTGFLEGRFTVQDEGAALAVAATGVRASMRVVDLCAAPGGKSIAMAEMMRGEGRITAVDRSQVRVEAMQTAVERMGFDGIITAQCADAGSVALPPADVVLVDAPCSGLGVLSRKPDIRWKRHESDLKALCRQQLEILEHAAGLVADGGALVYSTCTTEPEENERVVEEFLRRHPEFRIEPVTPLLPAAAVERGVVTTSGFLQTLPHRHDVDGMFAARLIRSGVA